MLKEMSLFCFSQYRIDFSLALTPVRGGFGGHAAAPDLSARNLVGIADRAAVHLGPAHDDLRFDLGAVDDE